MKVGEIMSVTNAINPFTEMEVETEVVVNKPTPEAEAAFWARKWREGNEEHSKAICRVYKAANAARKDATFWQGKFAMVKHENNELRKKLGTQSRRQKANNLEARINEYLDKTLPQLERTKEVNKTATSK